VKQPKITNKNKNVKDMEVPKILLDKWKVLRSPGDPQDIIASMPEEKRVVEQTIRNVYSDGKCSDEVFEAMAEFYKNKAEKIAQYI
jgi:hypothetical protein